MQYRHTDRTTEDLSVLGFGCMRFPRKHGRIDEELTFSLLQTALDAGVNYFDTAYIYPGSEETLGKFLAKTGCRDKIYIATKLPHYLIKTATDLDKYFAEQLSRLGTDHIDYYLMHMLPDPDTWERLKGLGVEEWIAEKKRSGAIRHLGFSYHGNSVTFRRLLEAYDWDFCQIQYNYLDEHSQAGRAGLNAAAAKGIPVIIMEPLRGGRLAGGLPAGAKKRIEKAGTTPGAFALRWLWDQKEVTVVLSGMNFPQALRENLSAASEAVPGCFTDAERALLEDVKGEINANMKVGCTGCGYCMPCPKGVDIPGTFRCWNERHTDGKFTGLKEYFMTTALRPNTARASQCVQCGKCKSHCPQAIDIPVELSKAAKELEGPLYKVGAKLARLVMKF